MNNIEISSTDDIIEIEILPTHTETTILLEDSNEYNYEKQFNLPRINSVELKGNKSGDDLGLVNKDELITLYSNINEIKHDTDSTKQITDLNTNQIDVLKEIVADNKQIADKDINEVATETETLKNNLEALTGDVENLSAEIDYKINRTEVEHLIAQIQQFKHQKVDELPKVGSEAILYLVPAQTGIYEEYIWLDSEQKYEDIGSTAIDLTEYAKTSEINNLINSKISEIEKKLNLKAEIEKLPTKLSQFENDENFIKEHQDLSNYVNKSDLMVQLLQKANANLTNVTASYDFVNATITYNNGKDGYRTYRNKRLEQWGISTTSTSSQGTAIDLFQPFKDTNYNIQITVKALGNYFVCANSIGNQRFMVRICDSWGTAQAIPFYWEVKGYMS